MWSSLLAESSNYLMWIVVGVLVVLIIGLFVIQSSRSKKREQEAQDLMNAVKPGNKVKTIGGICGIVVEIDSEENTFVLETGSETAGKSYIKFDKQAIYQTDAVVVKPKDDEEEKSGAGAVDDNIFADETASEAGSKEDEEKNAADTEQSDSSDAAGVEESAETKPKRRSSAKKKES